MSVEEPPVNEIVYTNLRDAILRGEYAPGERLTSVRLAERLGVSRTPVRAALARLKADGLIDMSDGRAAWVLPLTVEAVEQAYEIAEALESVLVRKLAESASPELLDELQAAVRTMEQAATEGDKALWAEGDQQFHALLRRGGRNPLLNTMLTRVGTVIDRVRFLSLNLHPEGAVVSAAEHRAVAEAIASGDAASARQRHEAHLTRVREENVGFLRASFSVIGSLPTPTTAVP